MIIKFRFKLFALFLILLCLQSYGQDFNSRHFNTNSGLSSSETYNIIQDNWGHIWISSDHGLNRYDGYLFEHFTTDHGLTDNTVFRFKKDPYGRIWCTTYNNTLFLIEGEVPQFIPYKYNSIIQEYGQNRVLKEVYFDNNHNVYVTFLLELGFLKITPKGDVFSTLSLDSPARVELRDYNFSNHNVMSVSLDSAKNNEIQGVNSNHIAYSDSQREFMSYRSNLLRFSKNCHVYTDSMSIIIQSERKDTIKISLSSELMQLEKLDNDHFWFSSIHRGVLIYDLNGELMHSFLPKKSVSSIYVDHENSLWVSTLNDGVHLIRNWQHTSKDPLKSQVSVSDLETDSKNQLWIGYSNGDIHLKKNGEISLFRKSRTPSQVLFHLSKTKQFYFFQNFHIYNEKMSDSIISGGIYKFKIGHYDNLNTVTFSSISGINRRTSGESSDEVLVNNTRVRDLTIESDGSIYFASNNGLGIWKNNKSALLDSTLSIYSKRFDVVKSKNGVILGGSRGRGLLIRKNNQTFILNAENGLAGNFVNTIKYENDSTIWVGTNNGISIVTKIGNNLKIQNIGTESGLIDNYINDIDFQNDTAWIGTRKGLDYLAIKSIEYESEIIDYSLYVNAISVNGQPQNLRSEYNLSHNQNKIVFNFVSPSFSSSTQFQYRYKLDGLDKKWNYTSSTSVTYSSLKAARYKFNVQFKGENKNWFSEIEPILINIHPPFWSTWWFIISIIVLVTGILYLFLKYKVIIYNGDVLREIFRYILKKLKRDEHYILIQEAGKEYKIVTSDILFVKSDKNYLEIHTKARKHLIREKIGNFLDLVPDPIEFIRVKRSYVIRIDQVTEKGKKYIKIDSLKIEVGDTYLSELDKIQF